MKIPDYSDICGFFAQSCAHADLVSHVRLAQLDRSLALGHSFQSKTMSDLWEHLVNPTTTSGKEVQQMMTTAKDTIEACVGARILLPGSVKNSEGVDLAYMLIGQDKKAYSRLDLQKDMHYLKAVYPDTAHCIKALQDVAHAFYQQLQEFELNKFREKMDELQTEADETWPCFDAAEELPDLGTTLITLFFVANFVKKIPWVCRHSRASNGRFLHVAHPVPAHFPRDQGLNCQGAGGGSRVAHCGAVRVREAPPRGRTGARHCQAEGRHTRAIGVCFM